MARAVETGLIGFTWWAVSPAILMRPEPRQPLRFARAGNEPELDFGQAELRVTRCYPIMAGERDLESAAQRCVVNRGTDRFLAGFDRVDHISERGRRRRSAEFRDLRAREECARGAGDG